MALPEGVSIIQEDDRDQDGLYVIHSGCTHIHPFIVPILGSIKLTIIHAVGGQDHSIRCWLGYEPLNDTIAAVMGLVELDRTPLVYEIFDELNAEEGTDSLPSARTIYLNILNRQNSPNNYRLVFE
jgi:hypothetical protein